MTKMETVGSVSNGGKVAIESGVPYSVELVVQGSSDFLFHRWNCDAVEAKAKAAKNSAAKKTDDTESYVYRTEEGELAIPGEYMRQAIIHAAKFRQDPRSPRKSAMDLYKAGVVSLTDLAPLGTKEWDYLDRRRVCVQRNGVTRIRPAMAKGYKATFQLLVLIPEYIESDSLREVIEQAGRLVGIGDFRPTFGRFGIVGFQRRLSRTRQRLAMTIDYPDGIVTPMGQQWVCLDACGIVCANSGATIRTEGFGLQSSSERGQDGSNPLLAFLVRNRPSSSCCRYSRAGA